MLLDSAPSGGTVNDPLQEISRLRRFAGAPGEFWPAFLGAAGRLISASRGILIVRDRNQTDKLKKLGEWAGTSPGGPLPPLFMRALPGVVEICADRGQCVQAVGGNGAGEFQVVAISLALQGTSELCVAAFLLDGATEAAAREAVIRLSLLSDLPSSYQTNQLVQQAKSDVERFASVMDVMALVNEEKRFLAAAMAFCNGLATRFGCDRVSLGWINRGYVRLQCMSRTERFDKKASAVQALEVAMEECADQDDEVIWPPPEKSAVITRDHGNFGRAQSVENLCSVPMRREGRAEAVILCERNGKAFSPTEVQQLRLACDQVTARLADLKDHDGWVGVRLLRATRKQLAKALGPEHTWAKLGAIAGVAGLILLLLPIYPYRVEGNFIVRSDNVAMLTAPFDGYIQDVVVRPGDLVSENGVLVELNTNDLELEEAAALAEQQRFLREAEKARAAKQLAEMRIAEAMAEQAEARLNLARYRLAQAQIRSPFEGVIVEGDLRQNIGAPIKQGETLYRVARIDALYVEAEIDERDVHEILDRRTGEVAFVSQPKLKFPVRVERVEPAAFPKDGKNIFLARCEFVDSPENWWRPGMSGVCKLDVERRTLFWIAMHRTIDFLRMFFWW